MRKSGRPRGQKGYLFQKGAHWYGQWRSSTANRQRATAQLGEIAETTEVEARAKLLKFIELDTRQRNAERIVGRSSLVPITARDDSPWQNKGAISELLVSADLLAKNYHVFRAVSHGACCDLIAMKDDGIPVRIEVKTAPATAKSGRLRIPLKRQLGYFDLLAVVFPDGRIEYRPHSEIRNDMYPLEVA